MRKTYKNKDYKYSILFYKKIKKNVLYLKKPAKFYVFAGKLKIKLGKYMSGLKKLEFAYKNVPRIDQRYAIESQIKFFEYQFRIGLHSPINVDKNYSDFIQRE